MHNGRNSPPDSSVQEMEALSAFIATQFLDADSHIMISLRNTHISLKNTHIAFARWTPPEDER